MSSSRICWSSSAVATTNCARLMITTPTWRVWSAGDSAAACREVERRRGHASTKKCSSAAARSRGCFHYVEDLLGQEGLGTFGHIITRAVDMLSRRQSVLQRAQRHARFILIDEFQDSNVAQIQLARLLAGEEANVFAVGDPDQAIYRFRGATSGAFDQFLRTFDPARVKRVTLSQEPPFDAADPAVRVSGHRVQSANCQRRTAAMAVGRASRCAARARKMIRRWRQASPVQAVVHNGHEQEA